MGRIIKNRKMRLFAILAGVFKMSDAMCAHGHDMDCKRDCHDEFTACRRIGTISYADCHRDKTDCYELCVCHETHREYIYIKHPVRSWSVYSFVVEPAFVEIIFVATNFFRPNLRPYLRPLCGQILFHYKNLAH